MPGKPPGSEVSLYYDSPIHKLTDGDYLRTPSGRLYEVLDVRVQERGQHVGRQHLHCLVITADQVTAPDRVFPIHWYARRRSSSTRR